MLAEGNKSLIMGASAKGAGHYIWTSGTLLLLERAKDMVFGQGVGVGEVAPPCPLAFLACCCCQSRGRYGEERAGELERVGKRRDKPRCAWFMTNRRQWLGES